MFRLGMRHPKLRVVAFLLFIWILAGLFGGALALRTPRTPTPSGDLAVIQALDFELTVYQGINLLGGQEVRLSSLLARGDGNGRPIVLNFWAGLCPPCRAEMPDLQEVHEQYQDKVLPLGLVVGPFVGLGSREDGQALLKELGVTYPAGTTFDPQIIREYDVVGMPTTFFIKPNGEIHRSWAGLLTKAKLTELVEQLLDAS